MSRISLLFSCCFTSLFLSIFAQSCSNYVFPTNNAYNVCTDLPFLNSFLHYTYDPSSKTAQIAYRHTGITSPRWVSWGINPNSTGMVGAQALVAFKKSDGTMRVYTSSVSGYGTQLQERDLSFPVSDLSANHANNEIVIFAKLNLQNLGTAINQVWQDGPLSDDSPMAHDTSGPNVQSKGSLNLLSGQSETAGGEVDKKKRKQMIHGMLNAVSWGILMPIGVLTARYIKPLPYADPQWFYVHVVCQTSAYILGAAGWITGLQLGAESPGIVRSTHRTIGIILFSLGTLQVFALLLRPKKDHKHRFYWNIYHRSVGYTVILLSIINILKGFSILNPKKIWEEAYISIAVILAMIAAALEVYERCAGFKKRNRPESIEKRHHGMNGYVGEGLDKSVDDI